jgi:hypothetical protein
MWTSTSTAPLSKTSRPRRGWRILGSALFIQMMIAAIAAPLCRAHVEKASERAGLALLANLGPIVGSPQAITLNGQRMYLASKVTPLAVPEVLETLSRHCRGESGGTAVELASWLDEMDGSVAHALGDPERWLTAESADVDGRVGQMACFVPSANVAGSLLERVRQLARTLDLSSLGDARYVIARREPGSSRTHVLTVWTQGPFDLRSMFESAGELPGGDPGELPPPPGSLNILSARLVDQPYALRVYIAPQAPVEVLDHYERVMGEIGLSRPQLSEVPGAPRLDQNTRAFIVGQRVVLISAHAASSAKTEVSLVELGGPVYARVAREDVR